MSLAFTSGKRAAVVVFAWLSLGGAAAALAAPPQGEKPPVDRAQRRRAFAKLREIVKSEPTIKEVQAAALKYYKLEPEHLEALASNARLKGLVPEIEGGIDNSLGHTLTNMKDGLYPQLPNPTGDNPFSYKERTAMDQDSLLWRVRAVWTLDRLVFNSEALDVQSLNSIQENLVREVTQIFFQRRRLLAGMLISPPDDEEDLYYQQLKLDELTSTLDALTGGMFASRAWKGDVLELLR
jgi:hypothetical protein